MEQFKWYNAVPWLISLVALGYTWLRNRSTDSRSEASRRREHEEAQDKRILELEVARQVDRAQFMADLKVLQHRLALASGAVNHTRQLLKNALADEEAI